MTFKQLMNAARSAPTPLYFIERLARWFFRYTWVKGGEGVSATPGADGVVIEADWAAIETRLRAAAIGGSIPAKITSGGPGTDYSASLYRNGPGEAATSTGEDVTLLQLDSGETVPANTWLVVFQIGDAYYGQVAAWQ